MKNIVCVCIMYMYIVYVYTYMYMYIQSHRMLCFSFVEQIYDGRYFVLSDAVCRTMKYLWGLALGLPPVSYEWVQECIRRVRPLCTLHMYMYMYMFLAIASFWVMDRPF